MVRREAISRLEDEKGYWDILIIGGGATGLGAAVESASRGYRTLLLEQCDFAKGTSSRSTKLIHGGVRYLQHGNISLVYEALHERGLLMQNAPHLVHNLSFVVPSYDWWNGPFYGAGLKVYDLLAGKLGLGPSKIISKNEALDRIPNVESKGLHGGVIYFDGQFDDSRLAINLAQTIFDFGGFAINYMRVTGLLKNDGVVVGVVAVDEESGKEYQLKARVVINATGIFSDQIAAMDDRGSKAVIEVSQGVHLVLEKDFLPGESAIMVPQTDDGRVLFVVPWHDSVLVGTTDTPMQKPELEPRPLEEEVEFILHHAARYMAKDPSRKDVKSVFAGLRPLVKSSRRRKTSAISREHVVFVSPSGLVTVAGGKWTTYRKMGEDAVDQAIGVGGLVKKPSVSADLKIHGWQEGECQVGNLSIYGSDSTSVKKVLSEDPAFSEQIHPHLPYLKGEVIWHTRNEMARTVEDVLARRTRALFLDANASIEGAPMVAELMANELHYGKDWKDEQISRYSDLAKGYILN